MSNLDASLSAIYVVVLSMLASSLGLAFCVHCDKGKKRQSKSVIALTDLMSFNIVNIIPKKHNDGCLRVTLK
jgi:hypothetical protein